MKMSEMWLRQNATSTSYDRGMDYLDEVTDLIKQGNKYTAQIYGSDLYYIIIETNAFGIKSSCSCPYDWGGICKHIVAVGLKIIEGNVKVVNEIKEKNIGFEQADNIANIVDFYDTIFITTDEVTRTQFLRQLFQKDTILQSQFQQFINSESKEIILENIDNIANELRTELDELDFDIEEVSRRSRGGNSQSYYDDYYENLSDAAIEIIEESIVSYEKKAQTYFEKGNLEDATRVLLGIYEATFGLETPFFEEYDFFDDLGEIVLDLFGACLKDCSEICQKIVKNEANIRQTINLIFERKKHFYQENVENEFGIDYDFTIFGYYFECLVNTKATAKYLLNLLENHECYSYANTAIYQHLAEVLEDESLKLKFLEDFANNSTELSQELMQFYFDKKQWDDFYRIARQSFNIFSSQIDEFLLEKIDPQKDRAFYIKVLHHFTKKRNNIKGYKKLKELWTTQEKEDFIKSNRLNEIFYVQILKVEQRFEDILEIAKKNKNNWRFNQLAQPILNIYPQQMLDIYFKRAYVAMGPGAQDRRKYQQVTKELKSILQIKQLRQQRNDLIKQLKNKYRNLRAFQDEMAKAGF